MMLCPCSGWATVVEKAQAHDGATEFTFQPISAWHYNQKWQNQICTVACVCMWVCAQMLMHVIQYIKMTTTTTTTNQMVLLHTITLANVWQYGIAVVGLPSNLLDRVVIVHHNTRVGATTCWLTSRPIGEVDAFIVVYIRERGWVSKDTSTVYNSNVMPPCIGTPRFYQTLRLTRIARSSKVTAHSLARS